MGQDAAEIFMKTGPITAWGIPYGDIDCSMISIVMMASAATIPVGVMKSLFKIAVYLMDGMGQVWYGG